MSKLQIYFIHYSKASTSPSHSSSLVSWLKIINFFDLFYYINAGFEFDFHRSLNELRVSEIIIHHVLKLVQCSKVTLPKEMSFSLKSRKHNRLLRTNHENNQKNL